MSNTKHKGISFKDQHFYVGIDVHKKRWLLTVRQNGIRLRNESIDPSPETAHRFLQKHYPEGIFHVVYEAGFCGFWICRRFRELGIDCIVVNPADVPTTNKEKDRKTDPVDSNKLARELESGSLRGIYIPKQEEQHLRSLCRLYRRQVQNTTRVKNRIKGQLYFNGIELPSHSSHWSGRFIDYLYSLPMDNGPAKDYLTICLEELQQHRQRVLTIIRKLRHYVRSDRSAIILRNLLTVPGIGFKSAIVLYTEIIDIDRFRTFDQLKSLCGLVPSTNSSGEKEQTRGITYRRNQYLRHILIEAAWVAIRNDGALLQSFNRLACRIKRQDSIVRIAVKLLRRIQHVWKNNQPYVKGVVQ